MLDFARNVALAGILALSACAPASPEATPLAGEWTLKSDASRLSYVSVKAGDIAENNRFTGLSGSVSATGDAILEIDLATVSTGVDIRNERMRDILFDVAQNPVATVTAQLDPKAFEGMGVGDSVMQEVEAVVSLKGIETTVFAEVEVMRLANDRVIVTTVEPVILDANSFELGEGLAQLQGLAGLPSISSAVPVTFSFSFER